MLSRIKNAWNFLFATQSTEDSNFNNSLCPSCHHELCLHPYDDFDMHHCNGRTIFPEWKDKDGVWHAPRYIPCECSQTQEDLLYHFAKMEVSIGE